MKHNSSFRTLFLGICLLSLAVSGKAQPPNDDCVSAIHISSSLDYCSPAGGFTIVGATESPQPFPSCWPSGSTDVWFTFFASTPAVVIQVNGDDGGSSGTLRQPSMALLQGSCSGTFTEILCGSDAASNHNLERVFTNLTIGELYYIRVDARNGNTGTFQLCIHSFIPTNEPSSDCPTAAILCDKSSFVVQELEGTGERSDEADDSCLDTDPLSGVDDGNSERSSVWLQWTCDVPGPLTFTLTPNSSNITEDLDFALYELPNGINNCSDKILLRCMASGENVGDPFPVWAPCVGPTGLAFGETDITEERGCSVGDNNFLAPLDMEAGKTYALVVNNFTQSGRGFEIEFGGSGTFLGPTADFSIDAQQAFECDKTIIFSDLSSSATDSIISWEWNFGAGAVPLNASGRGPHDVVYASFGDKRAALTVETSRGCKLTEVIDFYVEPCCADTSTLDIEAIVEDLICQGVNTGLIEALGVNGRPVYLYSLNGADWQPSAVFPNLGPGTYNLRILDQAGCESEIDVEVLDAPPYIVTLGDTIYAELGEMIQLNAIPSPFIYSDVNWNPSERLIFGTDSLSPTTIPPGTTTYEVEVINEAGCVATDDVLVIVEIVRPVFVPNVFSPNGDGVNDLFFISGGPAVEYVEVFRVFDRWGGVVYEQDGPFPVGEAGFGWDGKVNGVYVNPGVFAYHAKVLFVDQISLDYSGSVTVVR